MQYTSFQPRPRTLLGPGPADVHPRILAAMARPTIGHLDPLFIALMDEIKDLLRYAFRTENRLTMPVSGPGSVGMETCFVNLVEPGDKVVVCINGVFGTRMKENVERIGATAVVVADPWGRAVDPNKLEDALRAHPDAKVVAFVHAETSTGARSDAKTLVEIAHRHDCITIVDAVTALGGCELQVDAWDIDAVYAGSQKCLSCTPGLAPISLNERALERIRSRQARVQSWFMDLNLVMGYWDGSQRRSYHHTAPINALYGLHEALLMLREEGIEQAWARHHRHHLALRAGLEALGLALIVPEGERLPQLNLVSIPEGIDDATVRARLLAEYDLELGAGLGDLAGKVWRIGLMGYSSRPENLMLCLGALGTVLRDLGHGGDIDGALVAAHRQVFG
ncbi:serine-pyruvate aminotransferase/archaeal aspartate aminotransferase [Thioflavicoccus mobilis 8321]|uniref:Serine-pyruvate aminotransferase/archaeal aspartate aminotransferase n=1 Tax=Thioflavicoccus mobilis 8321 TaxID=765912 RepID=L0H023_9GAMM|nr:alanine--glyoxylate aminotransferase family protein [Thioflavicoccus mobilis]AGA90965.1 serine-pyruvate aminotransferase/archaeal aspartate aminotransferase [Thioflavicoccus mobilis 8321]